jgi:hypothetical protein
MNLRIAVSVTAFAFTLACRGQETVVIGGGLAKARAADADHPAISPLKENYNRWKGENDLIDPPPAPADDEIRALCRSYAAQDDAGRAAARGKLGMDDFYSLLTFAQRESVFAMRTRDQAHVRDALTAAAMIDPEKIDERDLPLALFLVLHAAERIGTDSRKLFTDAARMANPGTAKWISQVAASPADRKDIRKSWGYDEVTTSHGLGFIQWGFQPYAPSSDLGQIAIEIGRTVDKDRYKTDIISIADGIPSVWFGREAKAEVEGLLRGLKGGATVNAGLRPGARAQTDDQIVIIFIEELQTPEAAQRLAEIASKRTRTPDLVTLAAARDRLFCLFIQRSIDETPAVETPESIKRFAEPIRLALERSHKKE